MSYSHIFRTTVATPAGDLSTVRTYSGSGHAGFSETIAIGATNVVHNCAIDISALKSLVITTDQDLTLKTNDNSSPDNTLLIKAGKGYAWSEGDLAVLLLTADVVDFRVTNASGVAATLTIDAVQDATP